MEHEQTIEKSYSVKKEVWEWIKALLVAGALVFLFRWLLFSPYIVEGPSMQPNFHTGERLIVNKILYKFRAPERGEVIVFHAGEGKRYIKRVIALPGETVRVEGDNVYINGELLDEPYINDVIEQAKNNGRVYNIRDYAESTIPEGSVFVMGDNRSNSEDSRRIGSISYDLIVGRADVIYWPLKEIKMIH